MREPHIVYVNTDGSEKSVPFSQAPVEDLRKCVTGDLEYVSHGEWDDDPAVTSLIAAHYLRERGL